ncbi:uncharacterized protein LOC127284934 isoform X2 [Leptopilina boulardi]|nr:uncharacterized protein LOC127284934 isoform X2 [Leptopilina boulardi]
MEELETLETTECPDCSGPPPEFRLPPPPRPPFLTEGTFCSEAPLAELEDCVAIPMIDASYHSNPSLQSTALIITCTVVLLLMAAVVSVVFWKHKRKVQNLLPCKSAAAAAARGRLPDGGGHPGTGHLGSAVLYEDLPDTVSHSQLHNHHTHPSQPTIEMLDVKDGGRGVFVCSSPGPDPYSSQDLYNPVYEELSNGDHPETDEESELNARNQLNNHHNHHNHHHNHHHNPRRRFTAERFATEDSKFVPSDDEFAEDELSVGEPSEAKMLTLNGPAWGTCPVGGRFPRERRGKSPRSLDRRKKDKNHDLGEFHEGMLHLLPYFPSVAGVAGVRTSNNNNNNNSNNSSSSQRQQSVPSVAHRLPYFVPPMPAAQSQLRVNKENPYESVPVLGPLQHYSSQGRSNNKDKSSNWKQANKYSSQYGTDYFGLHHQTQENSHPVYTQVAEYTDTYSQPTDRLYNEDKYSQPVYYTARDPDQVSSGGRLYQGQPDSSFGSDSGYSHHTSGTTGTTGTRGSTSKTNHRKDKHRNSHHSHHSADYIVS